MAIQLSTAVRNARLDAIETAISTSAILKIFSGTLPANCAAADANGTPLAVCNLPSNYMNDAGSGQKTKNGTWEDTSADNTGTATHFRLYASNGTTCHIQGTVGTASTDMIVDNTSFNAGQAFTITGFTLTDGNQ